MKIVSIASFTKDIFRPVAAAIRNPARAYLRLATRACRFVKARKLSAVLPASEARLLAERVSSDSPENLRERTSTAGEREAGREPQRSVGPVPTRHVLALNDFGFKRRDGIALRRHVMACLLNGWDVSVACWTNDAPLRDPTIVGVNVDGRWHGYHGLYRDYAPTAPRELLVADVVQHVRARKPDLVIAGRLDGVPYPPDVLDRIRSLGIPVVSASSADTGFGLDDALFEPLPRATARGLLGIADERLLVVMRAVRREDSHHDYALFRAVLAALRRRTDVGVILFGEGSELLFLRSTRAFGPVPQAVMPYVLSAADIFVSTNMAETVGDTTLEAMACGLPVVAPQVGRIADFVIDGDTGLLVAERSASGILAAVETLLADESLRTRLGQAGRRRVEEHFTLAGLARRWRDIAAAAGLER